MCANENKIGLKELALPSDSDVDLATPSRKFFISKFDREKIHSLFASARIHALMDLWLWKSVNRFYTWTMTKQGEKGMSSMLHSLGNI